MNARLPDRKTPYHDLAAWIGSIPRAYGVEVFTSNYDLLMEQALEECSVPYFDGFSGSDRTFFDTPSMEQDTIPSRWARLWKLHGSINWWRTLDGELQRKAEANEEDIQMIHPSHLKYDQSRMMPYLAMQDRLRAFLGAGQSVLITCGYSFSDWHLNQAILQDWRKPKGCLFRPRIWRQGNGGFGDCQGGVPRQPSTFGCRWGRNRHNRPRLAFKSKI